MAPPCSWGKYGNGRLAEEGRGIVDGIWGMDARTWVEREGLLRTPATPWRGDSLVELCHAGALVGGLSVALDVRPDEVIGPLCAEVGGAARSLRILDVRDRPEPELEVQLGALKLRWRAADVPALVEALNAALEADVTAKVAVVLGEHEQMLQLWCVSKRLLRSLRREPFFVAGLLPEQA